MKTVFSVLVLFAASVICFSDAFGQTYMQEYLQEGAKARIGKGNVYELAYSPDNKWLAVASTIGIWIYDTETGEALKLLMGHTGYVLSVAFSPDGQTLTSGSSDQTIRFWDIRTGAATVTLKGHTGSVYSVVFSPDRQLLASGSRDELIRIWDVRTGELLRTFAGHAGGINTVAYSSDGGILTSYGADGKSYMWHPKTGEFLKALEPVPEDIVFNSRLVYSIVYSPDGTTLASGMDDGTVQLWDTQTGQPQSTLAGHPVPHTATDIHLKLSTGKRIGLHL